MLETRIPRPSRSPCSSTLSQELPWCAFNHASVITIVSDAFASLPAWQRDWPTSPGRSYQAQGTQKGESYPTKGSHTFRAATPSAEFPRWTVSALLDCPQGKRTFSHSVVAHHACKDPSRPPCAPSVNAGVRDRSVPRGRPVDRKTCFPLGRLKGTSTSNLASSDSHSRPVATLRKSKQRTLGLFKSLRNSEHKSFLRD